MKARLHFTSVRKDYRKANGEACTAIHDFTSEWMPGESIGLIGHNGAGKSTLLRLAAGITSPSSGKILREGKLASLLEVGTGFHPELTGKENIFLSGIALGMERSEIKALIDPIVAFAGVEDFLHEPIKHYSSGMKIRLGFAVAAHLRADILLMDEVLGVGDVAFQQQSFARMQTVLSEEGKTLVVVSHHLGTIRRLCQRTLWLDKGVLHQDGNTADVLDAYSGFNTAGQGSPPRAFQQTPWIKSMQWSQPLVSGQPATLTVELNPAMPLERANIRLVLHNQNGEFLAPFSPTTSGTSLPSWPAGAHWKMHFDRLPLMQGNYFLGYKLFVCDLEKDGQAAALPFAVQDGLYFPEGDSFAPRSNGLWLSPTWTMSDPTTP